MRLADIAERQSGDGGDDHHRNHRDEHLAAAETGLPKFACDQRPDDGTRATDSDCRARANNTDVGRIQSGCLAIERELRAHHHEADQRSADQGHGEIHRRWT